MKAEVADRDNIYVFIAALALTCMGLAILAML